MVIIPTKSEKQITNWKNLSYSTSFNVRENKDISENLNYDEVIIEGVAINSTITRNGVKYTEEELRKSAGTLQNKPVLKDHEAKIDNIVGRTTLRCQFDEANKCVTFEAKIMDEKCKEMIKDGRITNVSIGATVKDLILDEEGDEEFVVAQGIEFLELSLVPCPGDPGATINQSIAEAFEMKKTIENEDQPVEPTEPVKPVKPVEPTEPVEPVKEEPVEPVKEEPTEPIEPVEPVKPIEPTEPENQTLPDDKKEEEMLKQKHEEEKMAEEQVKTLEAENVKLKEQLAAIEKSKFDNAVSEYIAVTEELELVAVNTENLSTETIEVLTSNANSLKEKLVAKEEVAKPKGKVANETIVDNTNVADQFEGYDVSRSANGTFAMYKI